MMIYNGWKIERQIGWKMKCRGKARFLNGYVATHLETEQIEYFYPSPDASIPIKLVKIGLDIKNKLIEAKKEKQ